MQFYLPQCLNMFFWLSWLVLSTIKFCVVCASGCKLHQGLGRGGGGRENTWSDVAVWHGKLFPRRWKVHWVWCILESDATSKRVICWLRHMLLLFEITVNKLNECVGDGHVWLQILFSFAYYFLASKVRIKIDFLTEIETTSELHYLIYVLKILFKRIRRCSLIIYPKVSFTVIMELKITR